MSAPVLLEKEGNILKEERKLSVGAYLSQERKRRNIPLADVAKATRIAAQYLEALEKDEFHALPASIFIRGFLRTYAVQIGLDPKEVLRMYETQTSSLATLEKGGATRARGKIEPLIKYLSTLLFIAVAVGVAFFFFFKGAPIVPPSPSTTSSPKTPQPETPPAKDFSSEPLSAQQKDLPKTLELRKSEKSPEGLAAAVPLKTEKEKKKERRHVLKVKATETTWLRIQPDDLPEFEVLLQPDETATWTARRKFNITVGNAGGIEVSFNGKPLGALGESGQVVTLLLPQEIKPPEEKKEER